ncbi:30S ribosomal protein S17 [uncultured archaeon]|nr:30S ribosomal protein S17 [uncultured archaeon]
MKETKQQTKEKKPEIAGASSECTDKDCPTHGKLKVRGRLFEGVIKKKFPRRIMIEFERMIYVKKYERYAKSRTRIHARVPHCMEKDVKVGDLVWVQECRPLSKIVHSVLIKKIKSGEEGK